MHTTRSAQLSHSSKRTVHRRLSSAKKTCLKPSRALPGGLFSVFTNKQADRTKLKAELLNLISGLQRGSTATEDDKNVVDGLSKKLEQLNPTPRPLVSPLLNGKWVLVYTTSASILGLNKPAFLRPSGPIYQILDNGALTARNQETAPLFNSVTADLTPVTQNKVAVQFRVFKLFNLISVTAPESAKGELAITYLDEDLRISRGDKGNLFVLTMGDREEKP